MNVSWLLHTRKDATQKISSHTFLFAKGYIERWRRGVARDTVFQEIMRPRACAQNRRFCSRKSGEATVERLNGGFNRPEGIYLFMAQNVQPLPPCGMTRYLRKQQPNENNTGLNGGQKAYLFTSQKVQPLPPCGMTRYLKNNSQIKNRTTQQRAQSARRCISL